MRVSAVSIANDIMMRGSRGAPCLAVVVEGDNDARLYRKFFHSRQFRLIPANGKSIVTTVMARLRERGYGRAAGILDADFSRCEGEEEPAPPLFWTDTHDMETMLCRSSAFEAVLHEFAHPPHHEKLEQALGMTAKAHLLMESARLGFLRWQADRQQWGLGFKGLDLAPFFDPSLCKLDLQAVLKKLASPGSGLIPEREAWEKELEQALQTEEDAWQLAQGHDFVQLLLLTLQTRIGAKHARFLNRYSLESFLRGAWHATEFEQTRLWRGLTRWARHTGLSLEPTPVAGSSGSWTMGEDAGRGV